MLPVKQTVSKILKVKEADVCPNESDVLEVDKEAGSTPPPTVTQEMTVIKIGSLCAVAMDPEHEATPGTTSPTPSLIVGCSVLLEGNKTPCLLVYNLKTPKHAQDAGKAAKEPKLQSNLTDLSDSDALYDFLLDQEQQLEPLPIPTLPMASPSGSLTLVEDPEELGSSSELCLSVPLKDFSVASSSVVVPSVNHIFAVPEKNMLAVSIVVDGVNPPDEFNKPVGAVLFFSVTETRKGCTTLLSLPLKQLNMTEIGDTVISMSPVQLAVDSRRENRTLLACVTNKGCLRLYDIPKLDLVGLYTPDGAGFSHVVSCDSSSATVALASQDGMLESVEIGTQEEEGIALDAKNELVQGLRGWYDRFLELSLCTCTHVVIYMYCMCT